MHTFHKADAERMFEMVAQGDCVLPKEAFRDARGDLRWQAINDPHNACNLRKFEQRESNGMVEALPLEKYGFDLDRLEVGDILLSLGDSRSASKIAWATDGPFSHAMLYAGLSVIHADLDGVYSKNPQRLTVAAPESLGVLRLRRGLSVDEKDWLCDFARYWVGALYSKADAGATVVLNKLKKSAVSDKQFCSRLVAQAYSAIGIRLVKNPDYCSPNDLLRSPEMESVGDGVKRLEQAEIAFAASEDYNEKIQRATFAWLDKVRALAERRKLGKVIRHVDVAPLLVQHRGYDKAIAKYAIESGYPNFARVDRIRNSYRYNPQEFLLWCISQGVSVLDLVDWEQRSIDLDLERREANYANSMSNFAQLPLKYFALEMNLARELLSELECRQQTLDVVREFLAGRSAHAPSPSGGV